MNDFWFKNIPVTRNSNFGSHVSPGKGCAEPSDKLTFVVVVCFCLFVCLFVFKLLSMFANNVCSTVQLYFHKKHHSKDKFE